MKIFRGLMRRGVIVLVLLALINGYNPGTGQVSAAPNKLSSPHVPGEMIVKFKKADGPTVNFFGRHKVDSLEKVVKRLKKKGAVAAVSEDVVDRFYLAKVDDARLSQFLEAMGRDPEVEYAEPNYIVTITQLIPNDPDFSQLWGLHNTGQASGTIDADIDAPEAWNIITASNIVVGVIDTGIDYNHADLAANIWTNPGEIPANGIDDDSNGFIDDVRGWDFINNDNDPMDDHGHGTHVAGTIAAAGNNGRGVAGINWSGKVAGLKFLSASGSGSTANAVKAVDYANKMGFKITNNSWGGGGFSQALLDAISAGNTLGNLFVAAAGNNGTNNDTSPLYPSSYDAPNVISVAATDRNDLKASFSNYGLNSVDLGAPGVSIYSTVPTGICNLCATAGYRSLSGTSMATPHVAGAAALAWAANPNLTHLDIKSKLMNFGDAVSSLAGITVSGRRLNIGNVIVIANNDTTPPAPVSDLAVFGVTHKSAAFRWTATGDDGTTGRANRYDLRYSTLPIDEGNFGSAIQAAGVPAPSAPGTGESFTLSNLQSATLYYFALKVFDESGNGSLVSNVASAVTLINSKPVAVANGPYSGVTARSTAFSGAGSSDPDGDSLLYSWNFGDGSAVSSSTNITTYHLYANAGTYSVTLTVNDGKLDSDPATTTATITLNQPPTANAGPDQTALTNQTVFFDGTLSFDPDGTIVSYFWDFGDGQRGSAPSVTTHAYVNAGTYSVTLTVTDNYGAVGRDTAIVTVVAPPNQAPTANAGPDKTALTYQSVNFDGSSSSDPDGSIVSYVWNFGDGSLCTAGCGPITSHTYNNAGTHTVTLTVTDNGGVSSQDTATATISLAPAIEVFKDSFEVSEWNGLWVEDSQNDWLRSKDQKIDGSYAARFSGPGTNSQLNSMAINLQGRIRATVSFSWYINDNMDAGEYLAFDISTDNGTTWVEKAWRNGNVDAEKVWANVSLDVTNIANLKLRFQGLASQSNEKGFVDLVKVTAW